MRSGKATGQSIKNQGRGIVLFGGIASLISVAAGADRSWNNPTGGLWSVPGNWQAVGVPGNLDHVRIGNLASVENEFVTLDVSGEIIGALTITDGMRLTTGNRSLRVNGDTVLSGSNSVPGPGGSTLYSSSLWLGSVDGLSLRTVDLTLLDGASVSLQDYAIVSVSGRMDVGVGSSARGDGVISLSGLGTTFVNDGAVNGRTDEGLLIQQIEGGLYDLDGPTGDGFLGAATYSNITNSGSRLRVHGTGLTDAFSGEMWLASDSEIEIALTSGWVADAASTISHFGLSGHPEPGEFHGGAMDFHGELTVSGGVNGWLRMRPSLFSVFPAARVMVGPNATLDIGDAGGAGIVLHGGQFAAGEGASIGLNGATDWRGAVSFTGEVRQNGLATVSAPSTIDAEVFDMDGGTGTEWQIGHNLTINADRIDTLNSPHTFNGILSVGGGFAGMLTINLTDPADVWRMDAYLELSGNAFSNFPIARLGGSHVLMTGRTEVSHRVRVTAGMTIAAGSQVEFGSATDRLQMTGATIVEAGAGFFGLGTLENGQGGVMTLHDGVLFGGVGLVNAGLAGMGEEPGVVSVPWFENTSTGEWTVTVGGGVPGSTHDLLIVSDGTAALAGKLSVRLVDLGGGFTPQIGDEFTVLTALDGIDGLFAVVSKSTLNGSDYHWEVDYEPNAVVLRLASVGPAVCDADLNADGLLNFFDVAVYTAMYNDQNAGADYAAPWGTLNFFDVAAYMNAYQNGCP